MSDISEKEPSNTTVELSKALSSKVSKAESDSKHCGKIDTTPAEKEERSIKKSPSYEVNAEYDLKTAILNLSKQIRELQQEHSSTSFQHHRFYSNPRSLILENDLPKSCHSHSQSIKHLRSQAYTKKIKNYSNFHSSFDSQISSYESSSDEEYSHIFFEKKVHLLTANNRKHKCNSHQFHKKHKS